MIDVKRGLWLGSALMLTATCCHAASSQAQVFKCVDPDGHVVFSDTDCGGAKEKVDVVQSSGGLSPVPATGLTAAEKAALGQIEARDAAIAAQRAAGGGSAGASSSAPASAPQPSAAPKSSY
jgi:hypothetical protein